MHKTFFCNKLTCFHEVHFSILRSLSVNGIPLRLIYKAFVFSGGICSHFGPVALKSDTTPHPPVCHLPRLHPLQRIVCTVQREAGGGVCLSQHLLLCSSCGIFSLISRLISSSNPLFSQSGPLCSLVLFCFHNNP